jgi:HAMP domain-containing protein
MIQTALTRHLDAFSRDARSALRVMARTPAFTAVAVAVIALGTGANAAMFSVVDAVMLRTPFEDPDRIGIVRVVAENGRPTAAVSIAQYRSLVDSAPAFDAVGALGSGQRPILGGLGEPRRMSVECITAGAFRVLGGAPVAGRTFAEDEDRAGGPSVMVLSYSFWQRELGGSLDAIGRIVTLNTVPTTIIGIMPRRFLGPLSRNGNDAWLPLGPALGVSSAAGCQARASVAVFVRLSEGATFESAAGQATASAGIGRIPGVDGKTGERLAILPLEEQTFSEIRPQLLALLGAVALVLLIACANVANLQLERVFGRRRELAVQLALGATRGRVVRQILTENLFLYIAGAGAGFLVARWTIPLLVALLPGNVPHLDDIEVNGRILAATFAVAALGAIAVGLAPAIQATPSTASEDLRVSSRTSTAGQAWTRRTLVVGQIALSLTLLVGAILMVRTFLTLRPSRPGFSTEHKLTAFVRLQGPAGTGAASTSFFDALFERLRVTPGVQNVTGSTSSDGTALGSTVAVCWPDGRTESRQIVGVLRNTRSFGSDTRARPELYVPFAQRPSPYLNLIVHTLSPSDPRLQAAVRSAVAAIDPSQVVDRFVPFDNLLDARVATWRFGAWLLGLFAAMALLLAGIGLAASLAWWVAQRTKEIGVRMALGADPHRITRLVVGQGLALGIAGTGFGLAGAFASSRLLESWLYGVSPRDTATFAWSAAVMLSLAALACYLPARRATRIDPLVALRTE